MGGKKNARAQAQAQQQPASSTGSEVSPADATDMPVGFDGNRDPEGRGAAAHGQVVNRNLDMGYVGGAMLAGYELPTDLPRRPKQANSTGREIAVKLNSWAVEAYPSKPVYQYDVVVNQGDEKRGLVTKIWNSKQVQDKLGPGWVYDGNRIAWAMKKDFQDRWLVDLDKEKVLEKRGVPESHPGYQSTDRPEESGKNTFKISVRPAGSVDFASLRAWLDGQVTFNNACLEAINFLDHLLRETPRTKQTAIKRNFFAQNPETSSKFQLGSGVEVYKGVYSSLRPVLPALGARPGLSINVDVANGAFWVDKTLHLLAVDYLGLRDVPQLANTLQQYPQTRQQLNRAFKGVKLVQRKSFAAPGLGQHPTSIPGDYKAYTFDYLTTKTANTQKFQWEGKEVTVGQYYKQKYKYAVQQPNLPLVKVQQGGNKETFFPMELVWVLKNQRYMSKLSDVQTSKMIEFAVTPPNVRWTDIEQVRGMLLNWPNDQYLNNYGLKMSQNATKVKARVLPNPKVAFGPGSQGSPVNPGTTGRWDLRGKKFIEPAGELKVWGVAIMDYGERARQVSMEDTVAFMKQFRQGLQGHGVKISTDPHIMKVPRDIGEAVQTIYTATGNKWQATPQILFFIVSDRVAEFYHRIKKNADCRYGVVSQVMQAKHVQKKQPQYISNVCMKVNAKLGGTTARALGLKGAAGWFAKRTMIIGADVSHGSDGSIAAMTGSLDKFAVKYAAGVKGNGMREELIKEENIKGILLPMINFWKNRPTLGKPEHVIYIRDGVSEGQYSQVLATEVKFIREAFTEAAIVPLPKFTVAVATKRHHIRFFPDSGFGDKNNNAVPGTLVESGVTHPFEYDFYLCPHAALKGTARPVHYHVLLDEANMTVQDLQNMLYEQSYQYVRSTTPVSLHPAVYYAHLAAARAVAHVKEAAPGSQDQSSSNNQVAKELLPLNQKNAIGGTMWFV